MAILGLIVAGILGLVRWQASKEVFNGMVGQVYAPSEVYPNRKAVDVTHHAMYHLRFEIAQAHEPQHLLSQQRYGFCEIKWHNLSALDYAILADLAYFNPRRDEQRKFIDSVLGELFPSQLYGNVKLVQDWDTRAAHESGRRFDSFYRFDFEQLNLSVIATAGTNPLNAGDLLADFVLWSEIALFTLAKPLWWPLSLFSADAVAAIIYYTAAIRKVLSDETVDIDYYKTLTKYSSHLRHEHKQKGWSVSLTGHSLGGGLATIAGSTLGLTSLAFVSPGFVASRLKFGTEVNRKLLHPQVPLAQE
jgi:hypothetical protein